jgi:hypothetical protein
MPNINITINCWTKQEFLKKFICLIIIVSERRDVALCIVKALCYATPLAAGVAETIPWSKKILQEMGFIFHQIT